MSHILHLGGNSKELKPQKERHPKNQIESTIAETSIAEYGIYKETYVVFDKITDTVFSSHSLTVDFGERVKDTDKIVLQSLESFFAIHDRYKKLCTTDDLKVIEEITKPVTIQVYNPSYYGTKLIRYANKP